jgi:threonyl-tRNA synthetase
MGILLEHYAGKLPLWLSPVQVSLLTVSDEQHDYAKELKQSLEQTGIRCELDLRNEKIGYKIRAWNSEKINYAVILGKQEQESKTVSLRARGEQATNSMGLAELVSQLKNELAGS